MALQPSAPAAQSPSAGQPSKLAGEGAATPSGQSNMIVLGALARRKTIAVREV